MNKAPQNQWFKPTAQSHFPTLSEITTLLAQIAPLHLAESWDNVGLLSGSPDCRVAKALLTIDITPAVRDEALKLGVDFILSYHPAIFKPLPNLRFRNRSSQEAPALAIELATKGIWIYSPHTALDTASGGTNDVLAATIGAQVTGSFSAAPGAGKYLKLITFVPQAHVDSVTESLFAIGCGHIGTHSQYTKCSFRTPGVGTFQGDLTTHPAVGQAGRLEKVPEIKVETILPYHLAAQAISALKSSHPYEEPAFDLIPVETPTESVGLGRYAQLPQPLTLEALTQRCKRSLGVDSALVVKGNSRKIRTLGLVAGSAGRIGLDQAHQKYDCLITGEMKHHHMLAYAAAGINIIALGHGNTERPVLKSLQTRLSKAFKSVTWATSKQDKDPFYCA